MCWQAVQSLIAAGELISSLCDRHGARQRILCFRVAVPKQSRRARLRPLLRAGPTHHLVTNTLAHRHRHSRRALRRRQCEAMPLRSRPCLAQQNLQYNIPTRKTCYDTYLARVSLVQMPACVQAKRDIDDMVSWGIDHLKVDGEWKTPRLCRAACARGSIAGGECVFRGDAC